MRSELLNPFLLFLLLVLASSLLSLAVLILDNKKHTKHTNTLKNQPNKKPLFPFVPHPGTSTPLKCPEVTCMNKLYSYVWGMLKLVSCGPRKTKHPVLKFVILLFLSLLKKNYSGGFFAFFFPHVDIWEKFLLCHWAVQLLQWQAQ